MDTLILLASIFGLIFVIVSRRYSKCKTLLSRITQEPEFYQHWSFFIGAFYNLITFGLIGHTGVAGIRIFVRNLLLQPFSKTGVVFTWGGFFYPNVILATSRTEILKAVLASKQRVDKGKTYELMEVFAHGLIGANKIKWNKHRKILNPTFHQSMLQHFIPIMSLQCQKIVSNLETQIKDGPTVVRNSTEILSDRVMAMLMETIMGTKEKDLDKRFRTVSEKVERTHTARLQNPLKIIKPFYLLTQEGRNYYKDIDFMGSEARRLVNIRIQQMETAEDTGSNKFLIDALLREHIKDPMNVTMEDVKNEVITFLIAGWETTTWTSSFTLQLVGEHPQVQERIHQEIDSELGGLTDDNLMTMEDISKLKYLQCVINETLRLCPLVLASARHLFEDLEVTIDGTKRIIPGGTDFIIDHEIIHRSPRYWKDPDRFIPERFLPENSVGRDPLAFIPFSYGPRNCIGKTFGMCEEKIILAHIFRKFNVTAVDPWDKIDMDLCGIIRRTHKPIKLLFEYRKIRG